MLKVKPIKTVRDVFIVAGVVAVIIVGIRFLLGTPQSQQQLKINYAYQDRVADAASIIAFEKGFFQAEGLTITPQIFSSGPETTEALISGSADFGTMGDTTAIIVTAQRGDSFKIIGSHGGGEHRHRIIVANTSNINEINDLIGKRIGVKKGTSTHGGLMLLANKHSLDLADEIIDMAPSLQLTALAAGEVDAIVASEPTPSQAEANGYGNELATLGELNNTYPIFLVVNSNFAQQYPEIVVNVIRALIKAEDYINNHRDEVAEIQGNLTGLSPPIIKNAMKFHYYNFGLSQETLTSLLSTAKFLQELGRIEQLPNFDTAIDQSFLETALRGVSPNN
ncbi:MAG: ABC transporter substrate-binding protein [Coleofasciculus sp. C1-SOL-03]|jgi:aliphatic sulfonates family ABC transporter substrate-binding protein|uniref:ABC transporter substrate-binding protein n=1 Tax=Coleofasciculus sp. C1-SOL-03 TaxID=3069522 RepID=UPI003303BDF2